MSSPVPQNLSPEDRILQFTIRALFSSGIDAEGENDMLQYILGMFLLIAGVKINNIICRTFLHFVKNGWLTRKTK